MASSVSTLTNSLPVDRLIGAAGYVGSNPTGGALKVDCSSPQHPRVYNLPSLALA